MVGDNGGVLGRRHGTDVRSETKCFVCDVITTDGAIWLMELLAVNANLLENIGRLMGDGAFVIVSWDDVVCKACSMLLKYFTKLERDLTILKKVLRYYFKVKYHLEDENDSNPTISRQDIDYITECSAQVHSASDRKGSHSSYRTQNTTSPKNNCSKTEAMPRMEMEIVSSGDTISSVNQKGTNVSKKDKLETQSAAVQKRYYCENRHSSIEHCENVEDYNKQQKLILAADICLSPTRKMECELNVEYYDNESKRQKLFKSHSSKTKNDDLNLPGHRGKVCKLLFKEGALKNKCFSRKCVSTIPVAESVRKMDNVICITLHSDSEHEEDLCIKSTTNHMTQLPAIKSPVYSVLRKNSDTITTQGDVCDTKNETDAVKENKNQSIFSKDIIVSNNTKPDKLGHRCDSVAKQVDKTVLNKKSAMLSCSIGSAHTETLENVTQKETSKCADNSVMILPHSVATNGEHSTHTDDSDSSDKMKYISFTNSQNTSKRVEKETCGLSTSENLMKIIENNQIMIHSAENEWIGGLGMGLNENMSQIVLGDEMVADASTVEEVTIEETRDISACINESSYCSQREMAKSNISKSENLNTLCPEEADIDFLESASIQQIVIRTGNEKNANKTSQLVSDPSSNEKQIAVSRNSCVNADRTVLRSFDVKSRESHLMQENTSHISPGEKVFECHICNRILTTQSNLKRHLLKHKKCSAGSVTCELCNEQLVDRVHLKQHLKVQHQQYVKCAFCDKEFTNMKLCRDHELTHPERATYKCEICNQMFVTEGRLKNHKELVHDDLCDTFRENEFFKCHICFKTLRTLHNLKRHLTNHEKPPAPVSCNLCQEIFSERSKLYQHREEKHPKKHNCTFCNKEFQSLRSCKIHESLHPERIVYKCNICETVFLTETRLNRHKDTYHREPFCRICRKEITDRSKLIEHERRHGRFKQAFMCKECPKVFRTASGLKYHMSVHTGKYAVYCEVCGKGLHSEVVLAEHKATHTKEVRYTCELCGRTFSSNSTYRMHRLWHDNPLPYQCNFCDKKFKHTSILAVHKRRIHTGERPYKCKYCNMAFSVSSTRNKHLILHTKQYPYKCDQCNKGFTTRTKIANHLAKVHNDHSMLIAGRKVCEYKMALRPSEMADVENLHEFPGDEIEEIVL